MDGGLLPQGESGYAVVVPFLVAPQLSPGEDRPYRNLGAVAAMRNATPVISGAARLTFLNDSWARIDGHGHGSVRLELAVPRGSALWESHALPAGTT
ncbi:MAG: hypothetical protein LC624_07570 [Halobacteriales archaeon]|nr:hypothetical protein [Halobacteriales archaeon]